MNSFYNTNDFPSDDECSAMWKEINETILTESNTPVFHWKSFWIGNAAAILVGFALLGIFATGNMMLSSGNEHQNPSMYETLTTATAPLKNIPPVLINQASEEKKSDLESTAKAIQEIDRLIEEIRQDMLINGETPAKRTNLKRLYATKLDFYKDLLLKEDLNS